MRKISKTISFVKILLITTPILTAACQTTRLPTAVRSADNSMLLVQVSEDPRSLMWQDGQSEKTKPTNASEKNVTATSDSASLQMRAELLLLGRQTASAAEQARTILRRDLRNTRALKTLIKSALMENKLHEASTLAATAMGLAPQDAELYSLEGLTQFRLNHPLYAKALWNKALSLDPLHIPTLMNMGVLLFEHGHTKKAGAHFDRVLAIQPNHLDASVGRALVLSAEGQPEQAVVELEGLMKKTGDNSLILENLAYISRDRLKDYKRAGKYVERTLALKKVDRRSLETAVGLKQELRRLMAAQNTRMSDENLRELASSQSTSNTSAKSDLSTPVSEGGGSELEKMEAGLK